MVVAAAIVVLAFAGGLYWRAHRRQQPVVPAATGPSIQDLLIVQLTTSGNAERPAISPDGKYVAYVQRAAPGGAADRGSLWIRQVATSNSVQIFAPESDLLPTGLTFTPDGNFIDYLMGGGSGRRELWRVSFLGGPPKKLLDGIDTPIGWSPDGQHMAFVRANLERGSDEVVVADADGGNPRVLAARREPAMFDSLAIISRPSFRPAWSMDGRLIATPGSLRGASPQEQIVFVDTSTGTERAVPIKRSAVHGLDWLDAESLVVTQPPESGTFSQLWRWTYPGGVVTRLSNDLNGYEGVSLTAARDSLVTARVDRRIAIWVGDGAGRSGTEVASGVPSSITNSSRSLVWAGDRLLFSVTQGGHRAISSVSPNGEPPQEVVAQGRYPTATANGRTIVYESTDPEHPGL